MRKTKHSSEKRIRQWSLWIALALISEAVCASGVITCPPDDIPCREKNAGYCTAIGNAVMRQGSDRNPPDAELISEGASLNTFGMQYLGQIMKTGYKMQFPADKYQLVDLQVVSPIAEAKECYKFYLSNLEDLGASQKEEIELKSR